MTQVLSLTTRDMESVGAPVHRHMSLATPFRRRGSFELASDGKSSLNFFRAGSGRNRESAVNTADASYGMFEPLATGSSGQVAQDGPRDIICLCTPAPKIPRPRNAFILYRQHHQSQVTAENPKLSNPEISKIIGDKWKHESEDVKENWKKLAEEEKQRHQHQYPNYRYQPRRGTKTQGNWTSTSPTDDHGRCPKCHGRSISTPRTPSTPFSSPAGNFTMTSQMQPSLGRVDTSVPPISRRSSFELSPTGSLPFAHQLHLVRDVEQGEQNSPEMKRRRANGTGSYHAITGALGAYTIRPPPDLRRTPPQAAPSSMRYYAGTTLPDLVSLPRSQSGPMPPPLRPTGSSSWPVEKESLDPRHSGFDESLRLPPLQTSIPPSPARSPTLDGRYAGIPSTRLNLSPIWDQQHATTSLDAKSASMELSLTQKLKILSAVCDPLPCASNRVSHLDKRGAFISVEGTNPNLLYQVGRSLEKILIAGGDVALKVWTNDEPGDSETPESSKKKSQDVDTGRTPGAAQTEDVATIKQDLLPSYFNTILSWRQKSKQIASHVTDGRIGESFNNLGGDKDRNVVDAGSMTALNPHRDDLRPTAVPKIPVALVKGGFSLTISDRFASAIPILDNYTPAGHWQWMANMWRGMVNPDLVVHVQESHDGQDETGVADVTKRMGLISIKVPRNRSLDEATERRMAFEVMEWMREERYQDEAPQSRRQDSF
ncbi:hypothetical protein E4U43_000079 [Claviceps pusilla]|uniref:HMG box domain-containing protein n=1 Tax=Claviceps pusilla TaxID=123648 RepID=A0A9P7NCL2_9HYPO|nr:hypothetical protein E4U43_000079 [Claviceps pusilla]